MSCLDALLRSAQSQQLSGHLFRRPGADSCSGHGINERIIAAHQAGAAHPADQCVGKGDPTSPIRLDMPLLHQCVEGGLGLSVSPVAAEATAVG